MRTIVVGASWITKYFIADTLYNDGNFEEYIEYINNPKEFLNWEDLIDIIEQLLKIN